MESCDYDPVESTPDTADSDNRISRKYLLRQILVCSGVFAINFSYGLIFGTPTVLIPQLRQQANSSDAVSTTMSSWLSCTINYSGTVCAPVLAILASLIGRKLSFLIVCTSSLIGCIVLYFSSHIFEIIIGEILHGPVAATPLTVSTMVLTEYTSPRYRGVFLTFKSAVFLWGIWVANTIGTFLSWKNIAILAFISTMYCLITILLCPESPYWLATTNKFEQCAASHRWLKGHNRESEAELETLIQSRRTTKSSTIEQLNLFESLKKMYRSKQFYKPMSLSVLVISLYHLSGKIACGMYAIDIIKRITGTTSTAYTGMLILDGISVGGAYVGCGFSRIFKRRSLLLISSTIGVVFLFFISFYLYLIYLEIITEDNITSLSLLLGYSLAISVGPMIMSTSILSELIPVKYRSSSALQIGCYANFLMASVTQIAPFILDYCGARGLFMFFAVIESSLLIVTYKVLPETKDKTILEIQECLLGSNSNRQ